MALCKQEQVAVCRVSCRCAPRRPVPAMKVVSKKTVFRAQRPQHAPQNVCSHLHADSSGGTLHRYSNEPQLCDRRCHEYQPARAFAVSKPTDGALVIRMIRPPPRDKNIHVQKIAHGKSASIWRVVSTFSGGSAFSGGRDSAGAKIIAPVTGHNRSSNGGTERSGAVACCLKNWDTVRRCWRALDFISLSSSGLTLKEMVFMVIP
jgi:hypothetical protein